MKKVFIGGSRRISRLNDQIRTKLAEIVKRKFQILIGDANGADRAIQAQLAEWHYPDVTIYFVGSKPRNNEGRWPILRIETPRTLKGFEFYSAKDKEMAREADCGLMLWDGESRGTFANVENLVRDRKPVAVYVSRLRRFVNAAAEPDIEKLTVAAEAAMNESPRESQAELPLGQLHGQRKKRHRRTA